jgi:hypothetical protein
MITEERIKEVIAAILSVRYGVKIRRLSEEEKGRILSR